MTSNSNNILSPEVGRHDGSAALSDELMAEHISRRLLIADALATAFADKHRCGEKHTGVTEGVRMKMIR